MDIQTPMYEYMSVYVHGSMKERGSFFNTSFFLHLYIFVEPASRICFLIIAKISCDFPYDTG